MSDEPRLPVRPSIPPSLYALTAVVVTERWVLRGNASLEGLAMPMACAVAVAAAMGLLGRLALRGRWHELVPLALLVAVVVMGAATRAGIAVADMRSAQEALESTPVSSWELEVETDMSPGSTGWRGRARAVGPGGGACSVWLVGAEELERGTKLRCVGRFTPNDESDWGVTSRMQGVCGSVRCVRVLETQGPTGALGLAMATRTRALSAYDDLPEDCRAVLRAAVCGERGEAKSQGLDETFSACGVAHLMAVSGGHLAVATAMLDGMLRRVRVRPTCRLAMTSALGLLFVQMCGAPLSAIRAWLMTVVAVGSGLAGRRGHPLASVSVVALAMALWEPGVSGQLSYLLSVLAVGGLATFSPYARYVMAVLVPAPKGVRGRAGRALRRRWNATRDLTSSAVVAQLVTVPLTIPAFGTVSLVGPLANAIVSPLFTLLLQTGVLAAALAGVPVAGPALAQAAGVLAAAFLWLLRALASLPCATVRVDLPEEALLTAGLLLACVVLVWWPRVSRRAALVVALCLTLGLGAHYVRWRWFSPPRVVVLDVGQGDAILVADGAAAVLVDTGCEGTLGPALSRANVYHLDAVVLTHLHEDHVGGVADLVGRVACERALVATGVRDHMGADLAAEVRDLTGRPAAELTYGDVLAVGDYRLRVVWPRAPVEGDENADSIEMTLAYEGPSGAMTGLLTGDAERDETDACISVGDVGRVDFLKVGHHGSEVSVSEWGAQVLSPLVAVASAGEGNDYGHPRQECVDILEGVGARFLCTKDVGSVTVEPGASGPVVRCERRPAE